MSIYRRVLRYYRPFLPQTAVGLLLSLVGIGLNLLKPWPFKIIVDSVIPIGRKVGLHEPTQLTQFSPLHGTIPFLLSVLCLSLVVLQLLSGGVSWITNYLLVKVGLQAL